MSLASMPFVDSGTDTALHVVAISVLLISVGAAIYAFWKLHELPIHKAQTSEHRQLGLVTVLTWTGFVWHWVWVLAVIVAFFDAESAVIRMREIWNAGKTSPSGEKSCTKVMDKGGDELC